MFNTFENIFVFKMHLEKNSRPWPAIKRYSEEKERKHVTVKRKKKRYSGEKEKNSEEKENT